MMGTIKIDLNLSEDTRKQGVLIDGTVYSLHVANGLIVVTDNDDYTKIHSVQTMEFYKKL